MQQIAVRAVQLDGIEPEANGALRGLTEGGSDAREALGVERLGRRPLRGEGNGRGRHRRPGVLAGRERLAPLPRPLAGRLAPGMSDLDRKARAGRRDAPRRVEDARERRLVGVRVEAEAAVRDAPDALHRRRLHHHHAGARDGELHQVLQMPIRGAAVLRRILAHRRDDDAVGELDRAERKGREEMGHGMISLSGGSARREANCHTGACPRYPAIRNRRSKQHHGSR